jgi:hypothetical protein
MPRIERDFLPPQVNSMRISLGKSLVRATLFALVIGVGILAGVVLECAEVVAVLLAPLFSRRR